MKTAIVTDSNSGIFEEEAKKLGIYSISMPIIIEEKTYFEGKDLSYKDFYQSLIENKKVSTSQPSLGDVIDTWDHLLSLGYEDIVYIPMSSELSGSYYTAYMLASHYDGKVQVVDNHRISVTLKQSVLNAKKLAESGCSAFEIKRILEKNTYESIIYVGVETLEYLKKSGRVTAAGAAIGSILHIKPLLVIKGGKLDAYAKVKGTKKCKKTLLEAVKKDVERFHENGNEISIGVASSFLSPEEDKEWMDMVQKAFPEEDIFYNPLTLSIGSHVGPGAFGIGISKKI